MPSAECPDITRRIKLLKAHHIAGGGFSYVYLASYKPHGHNEVKACSVNILQSARQLRWSVNADSHDLQVAIKVIRDKGRLDNPEFIAKLQRRIARESNLWYSFRHENIIPLYGLARDPALSTIVSGLVSPWCEKGTVLQYVQRVPEAKRLPLIRGVANGLKYIHDMNGVHGDIKSANVLMSDDLRPLLTDFGCSKILGVRGYTTDLKTSMKYLAPELMSLAADGWVDSKGKKKSGTPTTKETDVWAFGLVCAEIVGGQEVFLHIRDHGLPGFILDKGGRPQKEDFPSRSKEADIVWPLLKMCWEEKDSRRPTMGGIVASLA
ncbi:hypothetical protein NMY22_g3050 [Coprinellus aureogranulatus]|nr:hypothetical protein NMY22_g3050 [Coprinellus aureogranulatus]